VLNTGTDLQRKIWSKISYITPVELKRLIQTSTKHAVPVVHEAMMNKLQEQQRLLWWSYKLQQDLLTVTSTPKQIRGEMMDTIKHAQRSDDRIKTLEKENNDLKSKCVSTHLSIHTDVYSLIQTSIHYLFIHSNSYINYVLIYISDVQR
jgi:hypothetical protein